MAKRHFIIISVLLLLGIFASAAEYPVLRGYVSDFADIIDSADEQKLAQLILAIEKNTTAEIAIVTVKSLEGMPAEMYSIELAEKNKIGKKDKDNGLLILIAPNDREYRIEVGYGLEHIIPDITARRIGTGILEPNFRQGEYGKGLYEAVVSVYGLLKDDPDTVSRFSSVYPQQSSSGSLNFIVVLLVMSFVFMQFARQAKSSRNKWLLRSSGAFIPLLIAFFIGWLLFAATLFFISLLFGLSFLPPGKHHGGIGYAPIYFGGFSRGRGGFGGGGFGGFGGGGFGGGGFGGRW